MAQETILIVEDDKDINELIQYHLDKEGYRVMAARDGEAALDLLDRELFHLIVLDIMLPGMDGLELCKKIKHNERTRNTPVVMLTAKGEESDIVVGLQLGADDYITKPFSPKILVARIKAVFRRMADKQKPKEVRKLEHLVIDMLKHKITYKDKQIVLTAIEFNILEFLSRQPGRVFSRDQIMDGAWREGKFVIDRAVDVHIRSLRKKLAKAASFIETVRGVGYRFKEIV